MSIEIGRLDTGVLLLTLVHAPGRFCGFSAAGCEPEEMGLGPIYAVPKLPERHGLTVSDIGLWELNEAFAVQVLLCRDWLGIPDELLNASGGAIALGHPYGATGARVTGPFFLKASVVARAGWSRPCASAVVRAPLCSTKSIETHANLYH